MDRRIHRGQEGGEKNSKRGEKRKKNLQQDKKGKKDQRKGEEKQNPEEKSKKRGPRRSQDDVEVRYLKKEEPILAVS
jgi:hypothetical protein